MQRILVTMGHTHTHPLKIIIFNSLRQLTKVCLSACVWLLRIYLFCYSSFSPFFYLFCGWVERGKKRVVDSEWNNQRDNNIFRRRKHIEQLRRTRSRKSSEKEKENNGTAFLFFFDAFIFNFLRQQPMRLLRANCCTVQRHQSQQSPSQTLFSFFYFSFSQESFSHAIPVSTTTTTTTTTTSSSSQFSENDLPPMECNQRSEPKKKKKMMMMRISFMLQHTHTICVCVCLC